MTLFQMTSGNNSNVVSFDKRALKLDKADDAREIVERINEHVNRLHILILSGNTLGIEAGEAIGKALETHSELTKALWSDMFTGKLLLLITLKSNCRCRCCCFNCFH